MKRKAPLPVPVRRSLYKLGQDIRDARRRRRITAKLMAERAGISRATVSKIERGDQATSLGNYASILFVLGMINRLSDLADATSDLTGRQLEEERLPQRVRLPRQSKVDS